MYSAIFFKLFLPYTLFFRLQWIYMTLNLNMLHLPPFATALSNNIFFKVTNEALFEVLYQVVCYLPRLLYYYTYDWCILSKNLLESYFPDNESDLLGLQEKNSWICNIILTAIFRNNISKTKHCRQRVFKKTS